MKLGVIIPHYNNLELVRQHIEAILHATRLPDELILVNDGGQVLETGTNFPMKVVYADIVEDIPWNQPGARNLGIWLSTSDALCFEDVDHFPSPTMYAEVCETLSRHPKNVIRMPRRDSVTGQPRHPCRGCFAIQRGYLAEIGGFDEDFAGNYGHDDTEIFNRFRATGTRFVVLQTSWLSRVSSGGTTGLNRSTTVNKMVLRTKTATSRPHPQLRFTFTVRRATCT